MVKVYWSWVYVFGGFLGLAVDVAKEPNKLACLYLSKSGPVFCSSVLCFNWIKYFSSMILHSSSAVLSNTMNNV